MTLEELKTEVRKYQYFEDTDVLDVALASIIATRLKLGDPLWVILIGASSGGKSQILRPLAMTDKKFMHRIDDLTENTFLSGMGGSDKSLLDRVGKHGMLVMSDLTVLFSKNKESRAAILSQFRMLYDGEMIKHVGSKDKPITWKGYLGVLAGSTPSIYAHFEEVADMGERFIYYRLKEYNRRNSSKVAMWRVKNKIISSDVDAKLEELYMGYLKEVVAGFTGGLGDIPEEIEEWVISVALFAERVRTSIHFNWQGTDIDRVPIVAYPMRVVLQLLTLARGLQVMRGGVLGPEDKRIIGWCGYSLANEEKRMCLKILGGLPFDVHLKTQTIADKLGLSTEATKRILQGMTAIGILNRSGDSEGLFWRIKEKEEWGLVREIEGIVGETTYTERVVSAEETEEMEDVTNRAFESFTAQS